MHTLLIVDDERNIRVGLKAMIEREFPSEYAITLASSAVEALELFQQQQIQIVITDIRMPEMDGLELIKKLNDHPHPPALLILSGYDDFHYAKEAITYKVKEYLLKPIVREELFQAMRRIQDELQSNRDIHQDLKELHKFRKEQITDQLNYILLHPDISESEIVQRWHKAGLSLPQAPFRIGVLKWSSRISPSAQLHKLWIELPPTQGEVQFTDKDGHMVVLTSDPRKFEIFVACLNEKHIVAWFGVSEAAANISSIKTLYAQAQHSLKYSFLQSHPQSAVFQYEEVANRSKKYDLPVEDIRKVANMLGTNRENEMRQLWNRLTNLQNLGRCSISYIEEMSKLVNELVFDPVYARYGEASVEILKIYKRLGYLYNYETIHDYFHSASELLFHLHDYVKDVRAAHVGQLEMKKAIEFIHLNYDRNLNMATVSNYVSLNYSYFSESFKAYTGVSFVVYLKRVRTFKAKELLEKTDDKIYEIAAKVGFENVKHFNRVFKEIEGVTAMEFREKARFAK